MRATRSSAHIEENVAFPKLIDMNDKMPGEIVLANIFFHLHPDPDVLGSRLLGIGTQGLKIMTI